MAFYGTGLIDKAIAEVEDMIAHTDLAHDILTLRDVRDLLVELRDTDGGNNPGGVE